MLHDMKFDLTELDSMASPLDQPAGICFARLKVLTDEIETDERVIEGKNMIVISPEDWYQFCHAFDNLIEKAELGQLILPLSPGPHENQARIKAAKTALSFARDLETIRGFPLVDSWTIYSVLLIWHSQGRNFT